MIIVWSQLKFSCQQIYCLHEFSSFHFLTCTLPYLLYLFLLAVWLFSRYNRYQSNRIYRFLSIDYSGRKSCREDWCERCRAFWNGSVHEFYRLKALITLEQVDTSTVEKKKNLRWAKRWGCVNFHCTQMSLACGL